MDKEFFNGMNLAEDISEEDFQYIKDGWDLKKNTKTLPFSVIRIS